MDKFSTDALLQMASQEATLMRIAIGELKGAIRPLLDSTEFSEHREIRKAFNDAATKCIAADALRARRLRNG